MEEQGNQYGTIVSLSKRMFLLTEGIGYGVVVPISGILIILITGLSVLQGLVIFGIMIGVALVGSIPFLISYKRFLGPVIGYLKNGSAAGAHGDAFIAARKRFYGFPLFHLLNTVARWVVLFPVVIVVMGFMTNNTHMQNLNVWSLLAFDILLCAILYYFISDMYVMKIASLGVFPADLEGKTRISTSLAFISIGSFAMGVILMVLVVLNIFYSSVEKSYINQMNNVISILDRDIEKFYGERTADAKVLIENPVVIDAAKRGRYDDVRRLFKSMFDHYGVYENVFISTPQKDSMIVVSPVPGSTGLRYRGAGYAENIDATLEGKFFYSKANKSPVTGLPVVLLTAPIKDGDTVIGILGLPFELGKFATAMVSETKIGATGYPFVTDEDLNTTGHPDTSMILENLEQYNFGRIMKAGKSGSGIDYLWKGEHKLMSFVKNEKYQFYSAATIYLSDINASIISAEIFLFMLMLGCLLTVGLVMVYFISGKLRSLGENEKLIERLSTGDLTKDAVVTSNDEIGRISQRLKTFIDELRKVIRNIQNTSSEMATSAEEMSSASVSFSDNAQSQAASAEEVTATVEEVSAGVENVARNSLEQFDRLSGFIEQMQKLSANINEMGDKLKETLSISTEIVTTAKMGEESLNNMTASMGRIIDSSNEMTGIVDMINDISEQINLLSLNAAIEAARAGDAGRGFAVVADEISKLADKTASSIKEIDKYIRSNNEEISRGKANITSTIETISAIITGVDNIGGMMQVLSDFMTKQLDSNAVVNRDALEMRNRSDEMKGATEEQKTAVTEIVKSVSNINELTQANASGAEEIAGTSESLASMAENLKTAVDFFRI